MADEINRTPPKTQSALLEAMQERQVTIDGVAHALSAEFFVVATQNPIEFEGTYTCRRLQLDRFLARIEMEAPDRAAQLEIYRAGRRGHPCGLESDGAAAAAVMTAEEARALRGRLSAGPRRARASGVPRALVRRRCGVTARRAAAVASRRPRADGNGARRRARVGARLRPARGSEETSGSLLGPSDPVDRRSGAGRIYAATNPGRSGIFRRGPSLTPAGRLFLALGLVTVMIVGSLAVPWLAVLALPLDAALMVAFAIDYGRARRTRLSGRPAVAAASRARTAGPSSGRRSPRGQAGVSARPARRDSIPRSRPAPNASVRKFLSAAAPSGDTR